MELPISEGRGMRAERARRQSGSLQPEPLCGRSHYCVCAGHESCKHHAQRGCGPQIAKGCKIMRTATKVAIVGAGLTASSMFGAPAGHASGNGAWCAVIEIGAG